MIENKHSKIGCYFSGLPESFTQHTVDGVSDLTIVIYYPGKFSNLLIGPEVAPYDLRAAHPELIILVLTILVFLSSCIEAAKLSDDTRS